MEEIEIKKPDDWHVHFRDNQILNAVVPETSRNFNRAIVMPNLIPPILTGKDAISYKKRIKKVIPFVDEFCPLMTIYLTEETNQKDLKQSFKRGDIFAAKLYPAGATTNSASGVKDLNKVMPVLETMAEIGMPLLIHGEVTDKEIDIFDREKIFIDKYLSFLTKTLPELKITLEHITTKDSVTFIKEGNNKLAASITPHHLALNRNALLVGGIRPHNYCLPVLKSEIHRKSIVEIATSGNPKFFLGTDTAPHLRRHKESNCGCAGVFNSTYSIQIITQIFDNENSLNHLEKFLSMNGAKHYSLEINTKKIKLIKTPSPIKFRKSISFGNEQIIIFNPEFPIYWKIKI